MNKMLIVGILLVILFTIGLSVIFINEGFEHIRPVTELREANRNAQSGLIVKALKGYVSAFMMALDAGVRWKVADIYISRVGSQEKLGQLRNALSACATAVKILHGYDDEGALSYHCTVIEDTINREIAPTPAQ